jgi:hypothetical protein
MWFRQTTPSNGLREVVDYSIGNKSQLINARDAKTQHIVWGDWLMEHAVSTTVTVVTGDRAEVLDLLMTDRHTVGPLPGGDLAVSRPTYRNKGNQSGRPKGESRGWTKSYTLGAGHWHGATGHPVLSPARWLSHQGRWNKELSRLKAATLWISNEAKRTGDWDWRKTVQLLGQLSGDRGCTWQSQTDDDQQGGIYLSAWWSTYLH